MFCWDHCSFPWAQPRRWCWGSGCHPGGTWDRGAEPGEPSTAGLPSPCCLEAHHFNRWFCCSLFQAGYELTACESRPHFLLRSPQCPTEHPVPIGAHQAPRDCVDGGCDLSGGCGSGGDLPASSPLMWTTAPRERKFLLSPVPLHCC